MSAESLRLPIGVLFIEFNSGSSAAASNGTTFISCNSNEAVALIAKYGTTKMLGPTTWINNAYARAFYTDRIELWFDGALQETIDYALP